MKPTPIILALIVLLTAAVRVPLLGIPFERDEGEYAYIAWRLGCQELPYRDWVDQKPPGVFWTYRLGLKLPFEPVRSVHFVAMLFSAASACALFFVARRFLDRGWAGLAAGLFAILSADPVVEGTAANTEVFMLLPLILSQSVFFRAASAEGRKVRFMLAAGVLTGIAMAFKQVAAVNWLLLASIYPVFVRDGNRGRQALVFALWSAAGVAAVWGAIAIYFWWRQAFGDFIYNVFTHNLEYVQAMPWPARRTSLIRRLAAFSHSQSLVWIFAAMGLVSLAAARRRNFLTYLLAWAAASLAGVSASGYFFPHYFQQWLPVLAVSAAVGAEALFRMRFWNRIPPVGRAAAPATLLLLLPAIGIYPFLFKYTPAEAVRRIYPGHHFAEMPEVARRIAQLAAPADRVLIFGAEPEVLFHAQRVSATRYIFLFPLYGPYQNARDKQIAAAAEIERSRPVAALFLPNVLMLLPGTEQYLTDWTRLYLRQNCRLDSCLVLDQDGAASILSGERGEAPVPSAGQRVVGTIWVRGKTVY